MFLYVLRLLLAIYFIKYYYGLLKPKVSRMLFTSQSDYLTNMRQKYLETKQGWDNTVCKVSNENGMTLNLPFTRVVTMVSFFQLSMIVASALLIRDFNYLLFICLFASIHLIEHRIMSCFYQGKETMTMMWFDRLIFMFNYIAYGIVIIALIFL